MDTNEYLRQQALRLITLGFSQKILAAKMGMAPSTFSKWLNQKDGIGPASVTALDGFNAYVVELREAVSDSGLHAIRPVDVSASHTPDPARGGVVTKEDVGSTFAGRAIPKNEKADSVPRASRAAERREDADFERLTRAAEQAGKLAGSPRADRAVGEYVAAPRAQATRRRTPARKPRR